MFHLELEPQQVYSWANKLTLTELFSSKQLALEFLILIFLRCCFVFFFQKCLLSLGYVKRIFMNILIVNPEYQFWIPLFIFAFKLITSDEFQKLMIFISINKPCIVMSIIFSGNDTNQERDSFLSLSLLIRLQASIMFITWLLHFCHRHIISLIFLVLLDYSLFFSTKSMITDAHLQPI